MTSGDTARTNLELARQEIYLRIKIREQYLFAYLVAVSAVFGLAYSEPISPHFLLVNPFLGLGILLIITQQEMTAQALGEFCAKDIAKFLNQQNPPEGAPMWDSSEISMKLSEKSAKFRALAGIPIFFMPCVFSILPNIQLYEPKPLGFFLVFSCLATLCVIYRLIRSYYFRKTIKNSPKNL